MKKLKVTYLEIVRFVFVTVSERHCTQVKAELEQLPFIKSITVLKRKTTTFEVVLNPLATEKDIEQIESVCRTIVGPEDEES